MIYPYTKTAQTKKRIGTRRLIVARLDRLSSEFIRRRAIKEHHGCQCCALMDIPGVTRILVIRNWKDLQWAHFKSKGKHSVRWDEANAAGLCDYCHKYLDQQPKVKEEFFRKLMGDAEIDQLIHRAETVMLNAETDYPLIELYLKQKIQGLGGLDAA